MRAREEKSDRAAVYSNVWEDERICKTTTKARDQSTKRFIVSSQPTLAFVEKTQIREIWPVEMLEKEGFAVQGVDR